MAQLYAYPLRTYKAKREAPIGGRDGLEAALWEAHDGVGQGSALGVQHLPPQHKSLCSYYPPPSLPTQLKPLPIPEPYTRPKLMKKHLRLSFGKSIYICAMRKWRISFIWLAALALSLVAFKGMNSSQPPIGRTGAPGEGTCRDCHSGGTGQVSIALTQSGGGALTTYTPGGGPVTLALSVSHSTASVYGFQLTVLSSQAGQEDTPNQGLNTTGGTGTVLQTGSGGRKYLAHSGSSSSGNWTFTWTPPATDVGPITWYIAANAANGNGATSGDMPGTATLTLQPDQSTALPVARPFYVAGQTLYLNSSATTATLYTLDGREVLRWEADQGPLSLADKPGLYLLRLQSPTGETVHKILIPTR